VKLYQLIKFIQGIPDIPKFLKIFLLIKNFNCGILKMQDKSEGE